VITQSIGPWDRCRNDHSSIVRSRPAGPLPDCRNDHEGDVQLATVSSEAMHQTIADIRTTYRELRYLIKARSAINHRLGGYVRLCLGWSLDLSEAERKSIAKAAAEAIEERHPHFAEIIDATSAAVQVFTVPEKKAELKLRKLAKTLPAWSDFGESVKGFGPLSLSAIVGEAGDLAGYDGVPQLWKRLGLGMVGDRQQGRPGPHATADDHIEHGYSKERRAAIFAYVGEPLLKHQNAYRAIYLKRKEYEAARGKTKMHAHMAAHRYAEKILVKHLWKAWRRTGQSCNVEMTDALLPTPSERKRMGHRMIVEKTEIDVSSASAHLDQPPLQLANEPIADKTEV
jgi:hypothetical protein